MTVCYKGSGSKFFQNPIDGMMTMFLMSLGDFAEAYNTFDDFGNYHSLIKVTKMVVWLFKTLVFPYM